MMDADFEIQYDHDYTQALNDRIRSRFRSGPRNATHASDLFYCLRKAHAKKRIERGLPPFDVEALEMDGPPPNLEPDDQLMLTWMGGLLFEDLVTEGDPQRASAYCWTCNTVSSIPTVPPNKPEPDTCTICGNRWLIFTPDYMVDGIIHEVKQTRKSRRRGPQDAQWWIEQLRTYFAFAHRAGWTTAPYARLVVNWIMGDYGSRRKGMKPEPPRAALDAFRIVFKEEGIGPWIEELHRRKQIVEGEETPPINGMGEGGERSPAYEWECSSCELGEYTDCPMYKWDSDGKEKGDVGGGPTADAGVAGGQEANTEAGGADPPSSKGIEA